MQMVNKGHLGGYIAGGDPSTWCPKLWTWAVQTAAARSVLDVGCGEGHSTGYFRALGCEVLGLDGFDQAIRDSVIPEAVHLHDFNLGAFSGQKFDLVWSCEFLEHIEERFLPGVLRTFQLAQKSVLITHAFPGQPGHHHVNCRSTAYWIQVLEGAGFTCDVGRTVAARRVTLDDLKDYPNHYARSGLLFRRMPLGETAETKLDLAAAIARGAAPGLKAKAKSFLIRGRARLDRRAQGRP